MSDKQLEKKGDTQTENGDVGFSLSSHADRFLKYFVKLMRHFELDTDELEELWELNPGMILKIYLNARDCRSGKGEKRVFIDFLLWLREYDFTIYQKLLPSVVKYGCWKDLLKVLDEKPCDTDNAPELKLFASQLKRDWKTIQKKQDKSITLCAKWAPSEGKYFDKNILTTDRGIMITLAKMLFPRSHRNQLAKLYRKRISRLRKHINLVETKMCDNEWSDINYSCVPSQAHHRYKKAFRLNDEDGYEKYLDDVSNGEAKINTTGLHPHVLVRTYINGCQLDKTVELQWETIIQKLQESKTFERTLAVVDVSGSMNGEPMTVAITLGLIISQLTTGPFKQNCITFSAEPTFHRITGDSLYENVNNMTGMDWGYNTNLRAVFDQILTRAVENNMDPDELPTRLFIFTDMQFDVAEETPWESTYEYIVKKYSDAGYIMPKIIFWNLRSKIESFPTTGTTPNVAMMSGFSPDLLKQVLSGEEYNPISNMLEILSPYNVDDIINKPKD